MEYVTKYNAVTDGKLPVCLQSKGRAEQVTAALLAAMLLSGGFFAAAHFLKQPNVTKLVLGNARFSNLGQVMSGAKIGWMVGGGLGVVSAIALALRPARFDKVDDNPSLMGFADDRDTPQTLSRDLFCARWLCQWRRLYGLWGVRAPLDRAPLHLQDL